MTANDDPSSIGVRRLTRDSSMRDCIGRVP